jgi:hypothetical protein
MMAHREIPYAENRDTPDGEYSIIPLETGFPALYYFPVKLEARPRSLQQWCVARDPDAKFCGRSKPPLTRWIQSTGFWLV